MKARYWVSCVKFTVAVDVQGGTIVAASSIVRRFIGQDFEALLGVGERPGRIALGEAIMTRLSCRQYPLLEVFAQGVCMRITQAQQFDQRPFRSLLIQGWIEYRNGRGFLITKKGRDAYDEFLHTNINRKNPTMPLTKYFDPVAYGLTMPVPKKIHAMRKGRAV